MMSCKEFSDKVSEYLEGRVPYGERIGIWMHALMCKPCRHYVDQMRETVEILHEFGRKQHENEHKCKKKEELLEKFRASCDDCDDRD